MRRRADEDCGAVQARAVRARREPFRAVAGAGVISQHGCTRIALVHNDVVQVDAIHACATSDGGVSCTTHASPWCEHVM